MSYSVPGNTKSSTKTNFWKYAKPLFGVSLPTDVGMFGFGLSGTMTPTLDRDFMAHGVPLTPMTDLNQVDPYQLAKVTAMQSGKVVATTAAVIPISWEMSCDKCQTTPGVSIALDILKKHDRLSGTHLVDQRPVLCAKCHADPALGALGVSGVKTLSAAMHSFHANKFTGQSVDQT